MNSGGLSKLWMNSTNSREPATSRFSGIERFRGSRLPFEGDTIDDALGNGSVPGWKSSATCGDRQGDFDA